MDVRTVPFSLVRWTSSLVEYRKPQVAHLSDEFVDLLACVIPRPDVDRPAFVVHAIWIMHAVSIMSYMEAARLCGVTKITVIFKAVHFRLHFGWAVTLRTPSAGT